MRGAIVCRREEGSSTLALLGPLLAALLIALLVVVDLGAYAHAVARAQGAADAAALAAAVAAHPDHRPEKDPREVASAVAIASGGMLVRCRCRRQVDATVEVTVRMPVSGIVIPRVWARSVDATASATTTWAATCGCHGSHVDANSLHS